VGDDRGGARDGERTLRGGHEGAFAGVGGAREAPGTRAEHADAHAAGGFGRDLLGAPVAHAQVLAGVVDQPHLCVAHVGLLSQPCERREERVVGGE
jgi:hypothetical protein